MKKLEWDATRLRARATVRILRRIKDIKGVSPDSYRDEIAVAAVDEILAWLEDETFPESIVGDLAKIGNFRLVIRNLRGGEPR